MTKKKDEDVLCPLIITAAIAGAIYVYKSRPEEINKLIKYFTDFVDDLKEKKNAN